MAVKALYGDLPVSQTVEAVAKRAVRSTAPAVITAPKPGPKAKAPKVEMPGNAEQAVRQMLQHFGMAQVLIAFSTILAEYRATAKEAIRVKNIGDRLLTNPETALVAMH